MGLWLRRAHTVPLGPGTGLSPGITPLLLSLVPSPSCIWRSRSR
ncbi:hypothetical protein ABZ490_16960 [Streptomyces sp. NPDC005811]